MFEELIAECSDYDFKEDIELTKPKSWLKTVCAYANGIGGKIFFGISNDKKLTGICDMQGSIEKITDCIDKFITPKIVFKITPHNENNINFIELEVKPGSSTPYYYKNEGTKTPFIRNGSSTIEAPDYVLSELILKGTGRTYDGIITGYRKTDFSFSILESDFFEKTGTKFTDQDFISFGLATSDGYLTNCGVLLADSNPYRHSRIFCTRWNGLDKTSNQEVIDDKEFNGSLIRQLKLALDFYKVNTVTKWHKTPDGTVYEPDYSDDAVLEALVNALIHRNYNNLGAEVCLNIYDDRMEITSPGIMVSGDPVPRYVNYAFESMRRNPNIADVFWRMGYMNRRGSGLSKITNSTNALFEDGKEHVAFQIRNSFFVVSIDNANYKSNPKIILTDRQKKIMEALKGNRMTATALADALGINRKTLGKELVNLENQGLVECEGKTSSRRWYVKNEAYFPKN